MLKTQLIRFCIAGAFGFVVDAGVLYLAGALGLGPYLGRAISFLCAVFVTWQINRNFTFTDRPPRSSWNEWWRYLSTMTVGGAVNVSTYLVVLHTVQAGTLTPLLGVALGTGLALAGNFLFSKFWVFKKKP